MGLTEIILAFVAGVCVGVISITLLAYKLKGKLD